MIAKNAAMMIIGDEGALLFLPAGIKRSASAGQQALRLTAPGAAESLAAAETLRALPRLPLAILFDGQGQDMLADSLPPVSFLDRPQLLARRLDQHMAARPHRGHRRNGRKGEDGRTPYLFAAIGNAAPLQRWLPFIESLPNPLLGLGLLPPELAGLALALRQTPASAQDWTLLITPQSLGGFRHTALRGDQLLVSRLTTPDADLSLAETLRADLAATYGYLSRLGLTATAPAEVILLLPAAARATLGLGFGAGASDGKPSSALPGGRPLRLLPIEEISARPDLAPAFFFAEERHEGLGGVSGGESLAAACLAARGHFALPLSFPELATRLSRERQGQAADWAQRLAIAASLAALFFAGNAGWAGWQADRLRQELAALPQAAASASNLTLADLKSLLVAFEQEEKARETRIRAINALASALADNTEGRGAGTAGLLLSNLTYARREGEPLTLTIGLRPLSATLDPVQSVAAAEKISDRLRAALPDATVSLTPPPPEAAKEVRAYLTLTQGGFDAVAP